MVNNGKMNKYEKENRRAEGGEFECIGAIFTGLLEFICGFVSCVNSHQAAPNYSTPFIFALAGVVIGFIIGYIHGFRRDF